LEESFPLIRRSRLLLSVVEPGGAARCAPTDRAPQLRLDVATLSAAYLAGVSFATLASAGRVRPLESEAIERADSLFATARAPYCATMF
jgi:predicted acetyltransferase